MRKLLAALAFLAALIPASGLGQQFPLTLPASTVYGRLGIGTGPGEAIPFTTLRSQMFATLPPGTVVACGGIDDTATIQTALNATGLIYLPVGCKTTSTLTGFSNTTLVGPGAQTAPTITRTGDFDTITFGSLSPGGAVANVAVRDVYFKHSTDYVTADLATNGTTAAGNPVLHFASVPASITAGMKAFDVTTNTAIAGTVLSTTATSVTMSANVGSAVGFADTISFGLSSLPDPITSGAAHLRFRGCNTCYVQRSQFHRLPYSAVFEGGAVLHFEDNITQGVWDNANVGNQEGLAAVYFAATTVWGNPTSIHFRNNNLLGAFSMLRAVTWTASDASLTSTSRENIGPKYGILSDGSEDITILGGLIGGMNIAGVRFENRATGAIIDVRVSGVHFDGNGTATTRATDIEFESLDAAAYTLGVTISGNVFNAEAASLHAIAALDSGSRPSVYNLNITGNSLFGHVATPLLLKGAIGGEVGSNVISNYNSRNVSVTDQDWVTAAHAYSTSAKLQFTNNLVGGGGNIFTNAGGAGNHTLQGIVISGTGITQTGTIDAGLTVARTVQTLSTAPATITDATAATSPTAAAFTVAGGIGSNNIVWANNQVVAGAANGFYLGANQFALASTNYHILREPAGLPALYLGNATDPSNFYDNTTHTFRSRNNVGGIPFASIDVSGLSVGGAIKSSASTSGVGYATGAGGTVTQTTSKSTAVTLNKMSGQITMNGAALAGGAIVCFAMNNSNITTTDVIVLNNQGGVGANESTYRSHVGSIASGSADICLWNGSGGSLSDAVVLNFAIIKAVNG